MSRTTLTLLCLIFLGCNGPKQEPLSPREVRVRVYGLDCRPCSLRALKAIATLPWIDQQAVKLDASRDEVRLIVTDLSKYDPEKLVAAFQSEDFSNAEIIAGPG